MTARPKPSRLAQEMIETAREMHALGIMDDAGYAKMTKRQLPKSESGSAKGLSGDDIRSLREEANMSQAVFAEYLHMTVGHVSKLERGVERPKGPTLVLLNVIRKLGIDAVM